MQFLGEVHAKALRFCLIACVKDDVPCGFQARRCVHPPCRGAGDVLWVAGGNIDSCQLLDGMSNLPDFRSWTGPARSGFVNESGGGNCEMSTFVPMEASGGMMLHPGPGPLAAGPGPVTAGTTPPSPRSPLPCAEAMLGRSIAVPVSLRRPRHGLPQ